MSACPDCGTRLLGEESSCVRCGYTLPIETETALPDRVVQLDDVRGHTAGFLQLSDIASAAQQGELDENQLADLLAELHSYLIAEHARFLAFPVLQPTHAEGVALVSNALAGLAQLVQQALDGSDQWVDLLAQALACDEDISQGHALIYADEQAVFPDDLEEDQTSHDGHEDEQAD